MENNRRFSKQDIRTLVICIIIVITPFIVIFRSAYFSNKESKINNKDITSEVSTVEKEESVIINHSENRTIEKTEDNSNDSINTANSVRNIPTFDMTVDDFVEKYNSCVPKILGDALNADMYLLFEDKKTLGETGTEFTYTLMTFDEFKFHVSCDENRYIESISVGSDYYLTSLNNPNEQNTKKDLAILMILLSPYYAINDCKTDDGLNTLFDFFKTMKQDTDLRGRGTTFSGSDQYATYQILDSNGVLGTVLYIMPK